MDKLISISIYIIYIIIAIISIIISYKVSVVMSLIVLAIESVRLVAIYKKVYTVIFLVFILNIFLIGYNSFKNQQVIDYKNNQIIENNKVISNYIANKDLRANTLKDLKNNIETIENISIDWWLLVGVYLFLELSLILLIGGINRQINQNNKPKIVKSAKYNGKIDTIKIKPKDPQHENKIENVKEKLEYVGSFRDYAKTKGISVRKAQEEFAIAKTEGRLIKQNGKNYIRV